MSRLPLCFEHTLRVGGTHTVRGFTQQLFSRPSSQWLNQNSLLIDLVMGFGRGFGRCPGDAPGELPQKYKMAITFVTMSITTIIGFRYQQHLIRQRFSDEDLEMYIKVRQIRERELEAIAAMERADTRPSR